MLIVWGNTLLNQGNAEKETLLLNQNNKHPGAVLCEKNLFGYSVAFSTNDNLIQSLANFYDCFSGFLWF